MPYRVENILRNCLLQAISPFLTMFSTAIYLQCIKMRHCELNMFTVHSLRDKFLQLVVWSLSSVFWEQQLYSCSMCGSMNRPQVHIWFGNRTWDFMMTLYTLRPQIPHKYWVVSLTLSQTSPGFYVSAVQAFWKHSGKRRNCS